MSDPVTTTRLDYADVVDLDMYPIDDLDGDGGLALVAQCQAQLAAEAACHPARLHPPRGRRRDGPAGRRAGLEGVDLGPDPHGLLRAGREQAPADHPRARTVRSAKHGIAYDYIPAGAPLRRLYESDDLSRFIALVLDKPVLYRSADPLDALQITTFWPGDELGWHFDRSEFSVTVMYQPAGSGGDFVYAPGLRSDDDPNYDGVQRMLAGERRRPEGAAERAGVARPLPRAQRVAPGHADQGRPPAHQLGADVRRGAGHAAATT